MPPPPIAIVVSRYNASITDRLVAGALEEYAARSGEPKTVEVVDAPGAYELPVLAQAAAKTGRFRGIVALGCVIKGETRHDRYLSDAVAQGLMRVSLDTGVPVGFGVITAEDSGQAQARAGGEKGNKGREAMAAVLDTIASIDALHGGKKPVVVRVRPDKAKAGR